MLSASSAAPSMDVAWHRSSARDSAESSMSLISEKRTSHSLLLEAVQELARRTGGVALRHFRSALAVEAKTDGSPVTIADRSAEQAARWWITRRFPEDGILGEEFGALL